MFSRVCFLATAVVLSACSKPAAEKDVAPPSTTVAATSSSAPPPASASAATASPATSASSAAASSSAQGAAASTGIFPPVGTKVTFRGKRPDGKPDTWNAEITALDGGLFQYSPHHDVANFFTKAGFRADATGIFIAGESLEGRGPVTRVIALPFAEKASAELPAGMFSSSYTVTRKESVTVPAGKYDAWRISVKDKMNPEGAAWIAPGAGVVKIQLPTGRIDELVTIVVAK